MSRRGSILENPHFDPLTFDYQNKGVEQDLERQRLAQQLAIHKDAQKAAQKEQNQKESNDFISKIGLDHIGDDTIDLLTDKQIQGVQAKLMDMQAKGADLQTIRMAAQQSLPQISNAHIVAKDKYEKIKSGLVDLGKDYPTGDLSAARNLAVKGLLNDSLQFDEKGNAIGYKDVSTIAQKDYVAPLRSDENIGQWYSPSGALESHIHSLPLTPIGESVKIRDKKGVERDNIWEGHGSSFSTLQKDPETGATIGQAIKSETVPLGKNTDGTPMTATVLPKEEFQLLTATPQAKADFVIKFNKHLDDIGINPVTIDPRAKDILQRQYAHDYLTQTGIDGSSFIKKQAEKQPLPSRISVKVNTGAKDVPVIDIYHPILKIAQEHESERSEMISQLDGRKIIGAVPVNSLDDDQIEGVLNAAKRSDANIKSVDEVYVKMYGKDLVVVRASDDKPLTTLTPSGANVEANKPLGQKSKQKAVIEAQGKSSNSTKPKIAGF